LVVAGRGGGEVAELLEREARSVSARVVLVA